MLLLMGTTATQTDKRTVMVELNSMHRPYSIG